MAAELVEDHALAEALLDAAWRGDDETARQLITDGADVEAENAWGSRALHLAAAHGHVAVARVLIQTRGANIVAATSLGESPLHLAAYGGHVDMVDLLLAAGADAQARTQQGETPLDLACCSPRADTRHKDAIAARLRAQEQQQQP